MTNIDIQEIMAAFGKTGAEIAAQDAERAEKQKSALSIAMRIRGGKMVTGNFDQKVKVYRDKTGKIVDKRSGINVQDVPAGLMANDTNTIAMIVAANIVKNAVEKNPEKRNVTLYTLQDTAIRAHKLFGRINRGEESFTDEENDFIAQNRPDSAELYVSAVEAMRSALEEAKASGIYVQVKTLDDMYFARLPQPFAKDFSLSGAIMTCRGNKGYIAKGSKLSNGKVLDKDIVVDGIYAVGRHKLTIRNIGGNPNKRELVALHDTRNSEYYKKMQNLDSKMCSLVPTEIEDTIEVTYHDEAAVA